MPDIGTTLRETRMRQRIDITQVEAATKIRAKYLRALENEEWDLLPGPTFVRTFLRTYGDYLGLDSKMLVEEYKQRFERPGPQDLLPFSPRSGGRRQRRAPVIPPFAIVATCVIVLLGALWALGQLGDDGKDAGVAEDTATATPASTPEPVRTRRPRRVPPVVRLQVAATGTVNVCLVNGTTGAVLIPSQNLTPGQTTRVYKAKRLRVTFGNGQARMRVNGRSIDVPDSDEPIGYELRAGKRPRTLSAEARPTCASE